MKKKKAVISIIYYYFTFVDKLLLVPYLKKYTMYMQHSATVHSLQHISTVHSLQK